MSQRTIDIPPTQILPGDSPFAKNPIEDLDDIEDEDFEEEEEENDDEEQEEDEDDDDDDDSSSPPRRSSSPLQSPQVILAHLSEKERDDLRMHFLHEELEDAVKLRRETKAKLDRESAPLLDRLKLLFVEQEKLSGKAAIVTYHKLRKEQTRAHQKMREHSKNDDVAHYKALRNEIRTTRAALKPLREQYRSAKIRFAIPIAKKRDREGEVDEGALAAKKTKVSTPAHQKRRRK